MLRIWVAPWDSVEALLGWQGGSVGARWENFLGSLGAFGAVWDPSGPVLGLSWGLLRPSWGSLAFRQVTRKAPKALKSARDCGVWAPERIRYRAVGTKWSALRLCAAVAARIVSS